jgi:YD repeat-containing protein
VNWRFRHWIYRGNAWLDDYRELSSQSTTYGYDTLDNLVAVTDSLGHVTTMTYDPLSRKTGMDDPDMGEWSYRYDAAGNLLWQEDAAGQVINFSYDELNRLVQKEAGGETLAAYGYDGGEWGIGQRTALTDTTGNTTWSYDVRGRVISETRALEGGLGSYVTRWAYDAGDRVNVVAYPTGEVVYTQYDARGSVVGVTGHERNGTWNYLDEANYNALG